MWIWTQNKRGLVNLDNGSAIEIREEFLNLSHLCATLIVNGKSEFRVLMGGTPAEVLERIESIGAQLNAV